MGTGYGPSTPDLARMAGPAGARRPSRSPGEGRARRTKTMDPGHAPRPDRNGWLIAAAHRHDSDARPSTSPLHATRGPGTRQAGSISTLLAEHHRPDSRREGSGRAARCSARALERFRLEAGLQRGERAAPVGVPPSGGPGRRPDAPGLRWCSARTLSISRRYRRQPWPHRARRGRSARRDRP
jgi:hypothetical protein